MIIKSKNFEGKYNIHIDKKDYDRVMEFAPNGWEAKFTTGSNKPYAITRKTINGKRKQFYLHRVIMDMLDDPTMKVDHINNNPLDNRRKNLRVVTQYQNMKNRSSKKTSACKHLGVSYCNSKRGSKKYRVNIKDENIKKGNIHLGYYYDEESAGYAYNIAAEIIHGEFANLNKINLNDINNIHEIKNDVIDRVEAITIMT